MKLFPIALLALLLAALAACGAAPAAGDAAAGTAVAQTVAAQAPTAAAPTAAAEPTAVPAPTNADAAPAPATGAEIPLAVVPTATTVTGQTTEGGPPARYRLDLPGGSVATFDLQLTGENDSGKYVLTRDGDQVFGYDFYGGSQTISERRVLNTAAGGAYLLQVEGRATYSLTVAAPLQQDGGAEGDAGDDEASAREVAPGDQEYTGQIGQLDPTDYYRLRVPAGSTVELEVQFEDDDIFSDEVQILAEGEVFTSAPPLLNSNSWSMNWALSGDAPEREYFLKITEARSYRFTFSITPQQDGGAAGDAGDSESTARDLALAQQITGRVSGHDPQDYYRIRLDQPTRLVITARVPDQLTGNFDVALWRDGAELGSSSVSAGNPATLTGDRPLPAGEYFLIIDGKGHYQAEVNIAE